jgi:hypothetical protein
LLGGAKVRYEISRLGLTVAKQDISSKSLTNSLDHRGIVHPAAHRKKLDAQRSFVLGLRLQQGGVKLRGECRTRTSVHREQIKRNIGGKNPRRYHRSCARDKMGEKDAKTADMEERQCHQHSVIGLRMP